MDKAAYQYAALDTFLTCHLGRRNRLTPHLVRDYILLDNLAADNMLIDNAVNLLFGKPYIHRMSRLNKHDRPLLTAVETSCLDRLYSTDDPFHHQLLRQVLKELLGLWVILADTAWFWHAWRCRLLTFENIEGWLWYTLHHTESFMVN